MWRTAEQVDQNARTCFSAARSLFGTTCQVWHGTAGNRQPTGNAQEQPSIDESDWWLDPSALHGRMISRFARFETSSARQWLLAYQPSRYVWNKSAVLAKFAAGVGGDLPVRPESVHKTMKLCILLSFALFVGCAQSFAVDATRPHIIFVMADDMGWGETGYRGHAVLATPNLDAMSANGLRFERFYAACPVCSPTRASVLTGRSPDRAGVLSHGYALRLQEKTIAQALRSAGYITAHFGKWHLSGLMGPGAPVLRDDARHPGAFGFDEWVSVTNFYDVDPLMSRGGAIEQFRGDSSEIAVAEAVKFLEAHRNDGKPMFAVVWFGSPHSPFQALSQDKAAFGKLDKASANHYGELVALDRSVGTLRRSLRDLGLADNTLLVFCSDNGGLPKIEPETVGGLRGHKSTVYEGGLRVPGIIEWPAVIEPRVTHYPACTMDLFPTVADILGLPSDVFVRPLDGISLRPLFSAELAERTQPIPFRYRSKAALVDNRFKLLTTDLGKGEFQLYDLVDDPGETRDLGTQQVERFERMKRQLLDWSASVDASFAGRDYAGGEVTPADPEPQFWYDSPNYAPYLAEWRNRREFKSQIERASKSTNDQQ